jgi:hypothetical protein
MDKQLFVSKYLLELSKQEQLEAFLNKKVTELDEVIFCGCCSILEVKNDIFLKVVRKNGI